MDNYLPSYHINVLRSFGRSIARSIATPSSETSLTKTQIGCLLTARWHLGDLVHHTENIAVIQAGIGKLAVLVEPVM